MKHPERAILLTMFCCLAIVLWSGDANAADVLGTVRDKAAKLIYDLRPLIFILAGFGLIGFAFAAIFGKINWKWFANIAIGLFLVANVGLLIDYLATKEGKAGQYANMLGYGHYLDASGSYTATEGSTTSPTSQKDPGSNGTATSENSNSSDIKTNCVPGTGTGCTSGTTNIENVMENLKNTPKLSADDLINAMENQTTTTNTATSSSTANSLDNLGLADTTNDPTGITVDKINQALAANQSKTNSLDNLGLADTSNAPVSITEADIANTLNKNTSNNLDNLGLSDTSNAPTNITVDKINQAISNNQEKTNNLDNLGLADTTVNPNDITLNQVEEAIENNSAIDGGTLDEVSVSGTDYSQEKRSCQLIGGRWNSSTMSCERDIPNWNGINL